MKDNLIKALFVAITVAIGMTIVMLLDNKEFEVVRLIIYVVVAFIVDLIYNVIFSKKKAK